MAFPQEVPPTVFRRDGQSLVSIVKGEDVERRVWETIQLIGGLDRLPLHGREVVMKPTVGAPDPPPTITDPRTVRAVVSLLEEAGASRVKVEEMSTLLTLPTMRNREKTGVKQAALALGAEVVVFDDEPWGEIRPPKAQDAGAFSMAKAVYEAEVFVSPPRDQDPSFGERQRKPHPQRRWVHP